MDSDSSDSSFVDDELYCGPNVTKQMGTDGTKKLLQLGVNATKGMRRNSFAGFPAPTVPYQTYEHYAPSIKVEKETTFIDKLAEILNETDSGNVNDSDNQNSSPLQNNIQYENSLEPTDQKILLFKHEVDNLVSEDKNERIIISDDEIDDDFLRYQVTQMKYEDITIDDISEDSIQEAEQENIPDFKTANEVLMESSYDEVNDYEESSAHETDSKNLSILDDTLNDMKHYFDNYKDSNQRLNSLTLEPSQNSATSGNSSSANFASQNLKPSNIPQIGTKLPKLKTTPNRKNVLGVKSSFNNIISPVSNYIHTGNIGILTPRSAQLNKNSCFKSPKPVTSNSKVHNNDKFKNIVSPIGMYIKHSGRAGIHRNLASSNRVLQNKIAEHLFDANAQPRNVKLFKIHKKIYKPAIVNYEVKEKEICLPSNITALMPTVPDMLLTKHEGRRLFLDEESTAASLENDWDLTNTTDQFAKNDVSILHTKPYI